jgi:hypothetical protein
MHRLQKHQNRITGQAIVLLAGIVLVGFDNIIGVGCFVAR